MGRHAGSPALRLHGVGKQFGAVTAVTNLHLEVAPGRVLGLLGPNGAGKSTTMRMLTGQTLADVGSIEVLGHPVPAQSKQARLRMGGVPQQDNLDTELTARQNVQVFASLYRIPRSRRREAVDAALRLAQLTDRADSPVDALSGGMRRRLLIGRGRVHQPELVLLDEPTVGLDPQVRQDLWVLIDQLRADGVTVLLSTHYIEEAERLADDVAIMSHGQVIARGSPMTLLTAHAGVEAVEYVGDATTLSRVERLARAAGLPTRRHGPATVVLRAENMPEPLAEALGPGTRRAASLEDVFVALTGEHLE